jgi:hypothetical protein
MPLEDALSFLPEAALDAGAAERASHGVAVEARSEPAEAVRLTHGGRLVAVARSTDGEVLKPYVVLAP